MEKDYSKDLEKINSDYLTVVNSREYKIGRTILQSIEALRTFNFKKLKDILFFPVASMRIRKYSNKIERFKEKKIVNICDKIAIYTVVFGNYDKILEPIYFDDNCDYYIITDNEISNNSKWKKVELSSEIQEKISSFKPNEKNRFFKMNPFIVFPDYKYSIYIDGNIEIVGKVSNLISYINYDTGITMFNHPMRSCIFDEGKACDILKKSNREALQKQLLKYKQANMPKNYGMFECNVIVRNNSEVCKNIMNAWWIEYMNSESKRDQLSFPYILWKNQFKSNDIGCLGESMDNSGIFRRHLHN